MDPLRNPVTEEEVAAVRTILQLRKLGYACAINNENSKVLAVTDGGIDMDIIDALRMLSDDYLVDTALNEVTDAVMKIYHECPTWPVMKTSTLLGVISQYHMQLRAAEASDGDGD